MRVAVLGEGYAGAVGAFVGANLLAADTCSTLAHRLQGYAAMAGDDATAADFAASYDEAATEALSALASLVGAFGTLGHLTQASLTNHHAAEVASGGYSVSAPPTRADDSVGVRVATPPSSLGGDLAGVPGPVAWILDQIEGFVWPDADTGRLRSAAGTWRTAAETVALLTTYCDTAAGDLADELSPEIPLALATTTDLRARVDTLADQLFALAGACETYADHVDAKRAEMLDLLQSLAIELAAGAVIGGALTVLSAGLAAPAAGAAGSARLAWAARGLKLIVDSLRLLTAGPALELRAAGASAREVRVFTERINGARVLASGRNTASTAGRTVGEWRPGWLASHEIARSHTLERHVGKSDEYLAGRLARRKIPFASTFTDQPRAEHFIERVIATRRSAIDAWLRSGTPSERFTSTFGEATGRSMARDGAIVDARSVRVVLERDTSMPEGFRVLTAFPEP